MESFKILFVLFISLGGIIGFPSIEATSQNSLFSAYLCVMHLAFTLSLTSALLAAKYPPPTTFRGLVWSAIVSASVAVALGTYIAFTAATAY
ncbi:hypothetical protein QJS04_geneDACA013337 [Acorus gramineus]|uniref:NADH dehydrogenase subunit 6 n=1 Tax=Acorus gramineus TaxID=55184 RepID=A0AAV9A9R8_ACOGR|nr:hypothetical protein QJS04_geneDACA013337 [Acorus gramineus]